MFATLKRILLGILSIGGLVLGTLGMRNDDPWTGALGIIIALFSLFFLLRALWDLVGVVVKAVIITFILLALLFVTGGMEFVFRPLPDNIKAAMPSLAKKYPSNFDGYIAVDTQDTIIINKQRLKLYGIRVPSLTQNCYTADEEAYLCGQVALDGLKEIADDEKGICYLKDKDVAQCFIDRKDISRIMVEKGLAQSIVPEYTDAEAIAKAEKTGIWQGKFLIMPGNSSKKAKGAFSYLFNLF